MVVCSPFFYLLVGDMLTYLWIWNFALSFLFCRLASDYYSLYDPVLADKYTVSSWIIVPAPAYLVLKVIIDKVKKFRKRMKKE